MKKNLALHILLIFLIVVNSIFLYNYMGGTTNKKPRRPQQPDNFIVKELDFNNNQLTQFEERSQSHKKAMRLLSEDIKLLKDALFEELSYASVNEKAIDSITSLLGQKEKEKRTNVFYHFKGIQKICNEKQRKKFDKIIVDALHNRGKKDKDLPGLKTKDTHRPPPPQE